LHPGAGPIWGRSTFAVFVVASALGVALNPLSVAADQIQVCLELAAEPDDPELPDVAGKPFGAIPHSEAIAACEAAMLEDPLDPAVQYALSRAMVEHDTTVADPAYVDESMDLLISASGAGYPAAMTALGELLYNDGEATESELAEARSLFERAARDGHTRAAEWIAFLDDQAWGDVPPLTVEDFARPEIIGGIYYGRFDETQDFQLGLVIEQVGISAGLSTYLITLGETLQQRWYCPLMLPPHTVHSLRTVGERQYHKYYRDPMSDFFGQGAGGDDFGRTLMEIFGPLIEEFEQRARQAEQSGRPFNFFSMINDLDHRAQMGSLGLKQMQDAAQRDATVFYQYYGCDSPQSLHFGEQLAEFAHQWNRNP